MLLYLIPTIVFITSLTGLIIIALRKAPVLAELSITADQEQTTFLNGNGKKIVEAVKGKIKLEKTLQKVLSKVAIFTMRIGNKTNLWLAHSRQKTTKEKDNYWQKFQGKKGDNQPGK